MKNWMKDAVPKSRKGIFAEKAARAGKTTSEFANEKQHAKGALGKEARLAKVFEKERPKK